MTEVRHERLAMIDGVEVVGGALWSCRDLGCLSAAERHEVDRLAGTARSNEYAAGRLLLRTLLAGSLGCSPAAVPLWAQCERCARPHGRPRVGGDQRFVSLAHSGGHLVAAVGTQPVGVDVEPLDRVVTEDVRRRLGWTTSSDRALRAWTQVEAVAKLLGSGLDDDLLAVEVPARRGRDAGTVVVGRPPAAVAVRTFEARRSVVSLATWAP